MSDIQVFKHEIIDGLSDKIKAGASLRYCAQLQDPKLSQDAAKDYYKSLAHSYAENFDVDSIDFDLYYIATILVSTGWNRNDDVFLNPVVWAAKHTPVHKQLNLEHNPAKIIGHMTSARAVDEEYNLIDENTLVQDLPAKFHILTGAVIYKQICNDDLQKEVSQLIEEIENGDWFVSMECLSKGFDYAVISPNGEEKILARNDETSFLTKHLRCYGGSGKYDNYVVGRCLKDITFSGKGLVRKPANLDSIIFNEKIKSFKASFVDLGYILTSSVSNSSESDIMANELEKNNDQVKAYEDQIAALNDRVSNLETSLKASQDDVTSKTSALDQLTKEKDEVTTELTSAKDRVVQLEKELNEIKAAEKTRHRVESLVKLGAKEEEAVKLVELFADKTDEQFESFAQLMADKWTVASASVAQTETDSVETPAVAEKEEVEVPNVIEEAQPEGAEAALAADTAPEVENLRKSLATLFGGYLQNTSEAK